MNMAPQFENIPLQPGAQPLKYSNCPDIQDIS